MQGKRNVKQYKAIGYLTISIAWYMISDWSIPITRVAPALAANIESIPVPHPTSKTILESTQRVKLWHFDNKGN